MAYNPYGTPAKNESASQKKARQKKFYSYQRADAEGKGDQKTVDKIYGKLGKAAPKVSKPKAKKPDPVAMRGQLPIQKRERAEASSDKGKKRIAQLKSTPQKVGMDKKRSPSRG